MLEGLQTDVRLALGRDGPVGLLAVLPARSAAVFGCGFRCFSERNQTASFRRIVPRGLRAPTESQRGEIIEKTPTDRRRLAATE